MKTSIQCDTDRTVFVVIAFSCIVYLLAVVYAKRLWLVLYELDSLPRRMKDGIFLSEQKIQCMVCVKFVGTVKLQ
jgi:hypothetical protein